MLTATPPKGFGPSTPQRPFTALAACVALCLSGACAEPQRPRAAKPTSASVSPAQTPSNQPPGGPTPPAAGAAPQHPVGVRVPYQQLAAVEDAISRAMQRGELVGAVVEFGSSDGVLLRRSLGLRSASSEDAAQGAQWLHTYTRFDLASLTKPFTALTLLLIARQHDLDVSEPVSRYLADFAVNGKQHITIQDLLQHTSGLPAANPLSDYSGSAPEVRGKLLSMAPVRPRGNFLYSDVNYIVLGWLIEQLSGEPLASAMQHELLAPLGLKHTSFQPLGQPRGAGVEFAPTERAQLHPAQPGSAGSVASMLEGVVHDPRARALGGVAGHAGLFADVADLGKLARALLTAQAPLTRELQAKMLAPSTAGNWGLGWQLRRSDPRVFGHYGFTGTSLWVDPVRDGYVSLLTSRLHPRGKGSADTLRGDLQRISHSLYAAKLPQLEAPLAGIDVLREAGFKALRGAKVLLLTNRSARSRDGTTSAELLRDAPGVTLVGLLTPEHGLDAQGSGWIKSGHDSWTGAATRSLYSPGLEILPSKLSDADTIVFDLQDVGVRFYTYLSTLHALLRTASASGQRVVVLDRINPLGGERVSGPVPDKRKPTFVHHFRFPLRHGLTAGEFARMVVSVEQLKVQLTVVKVENWKRTEPASERALWAPPSPNLPVVQAVMLYPMLGNFETARLSVGRGTPTPFELFGAPYIDSGKLLAELGAVPGLSASPVSFVPRGSTFRGVRCHGLKLQVSDEASFDPMLGMLSLARALTKLYPKQFDLTRLDDLLANRDTLAALRRGEDPAAIQQSWQAELQAFSAARRPFLLYD